MVTISFRLWSFTQNSYPSIAFFKFNTVLTHHRRDKIPVGVLRKCRFYKVTVITQEVIGTDIIVSKVTATATSNKDFFFRFFCTDLRLVLVGHACPLLLHTSSQLHLRQLRSRQIFHSLRFCFLHFCITKHALCP